MEPNNTILMDKKDQERWIPILQEYYLQKGLDERKIQETIDLILKEAQIGWPRAPKDIDTRIKIKSGYQWKSHGNLKPNLNSVYTEIKEEEPEENFSDDYLVKSLSNNEKDWWRLRRTEYMRDFEFNSSSDKILLEQLLAEEVIQRRTLIDQLGSRNRDFSKQLNDILKRITDLQTKLGITREQRAGILDSIDGNVAQLALSLDKKLEAMPEELRKQYEQELYYINLKQQKPPINILPPIEKIEALLQVGGSISTNIGSERIAEITEVVSKEVADAKEVKKVELADGVDVSQ